MTHETEKSRGLGSSLPAKLALVLTGFSSMISSLLSGLLLIDIAETFDITVAMAGQMRTFSFAVSILFALLTSILSLRYSHKLLLQAGLLAYVASSIGCFISPSFTAVVASFSLTGIGYALATTMAFTLVSDLYPPERRGEMVGWIIAGMSGSYLVGAFTVPYLQSMGGWRVTFIGYMLPSTALALALTTMAIPVEAQSHGAGAQEGLRESYLSIFSNRSALSSLLGYLLAMAAWQSVMTYNSSFFREWFGITIGEASIVILFGALLYTLGSIACGRIVNRVGRKRLTVFSTLGLGVLVMSYTHMPSFLASGGVLCLACLLGGMMDAASTNLIMEQLPQFAGTMMSLSRAVTQVGFSIGAGLGGSLLLLHGYQRMFLALGALALASAVVFRFYTHDRTPEKDGTGDSPTPQEI